MIKSYNTSAMKLNQFAFLRAFGRRFSSQIEPPIECFFNSMKDIPGYEGRYAVTEDGRIWSYPKKQGNGLTKGKFLKPGITQWGYEFVVLDRWKSLHRLIALTYLPNPFRLPHVNHKNKIRTDNRVENLEWCTPKYNILHSYQTGRISARKKKVAMIGIDGIQIKSFNSTAEAQRLTNISSNSISMVARGTKKSAGGYIWQYIP